MNYTELAPRFRSRKAFVKDIEGIRALKAQRGDTEEDTHKLNAYIHGNDDSSASLYRGLVAFGDLTHPERYLSISKCLKENMWDLTLVRNTWIRIFIIYQIKFYIREVLRKEYVDLKDWAPTAIGLPVTFGDLVAMLAIFGNRALFENSLKFSLDLFDRGLVGGAITSLTQLFMLRLSEHFLGLPPRQWLNDKYWGVDPREKEPLFAALWEHWSDKDTHALEPLLIQLLNRHSFQASRNNKDGGRDFEDHAEQFPLEVHFIFRLREWRGLSNPMLKHRIMEPPFDVLPEPMAELIFDEESIALMQKVRTVFADVDEVVNAAKIRDWAMLL